MINDETLKEIETLCSQGVDLTIALTALDLPASLVSDPQVRQVSERGRAICAVKVAEALTKAAQRGDAGAARTLLDRISDPVDPVEPEKPFSFWSTEPSDAVRQYDKWINEAMEAVLRGGTAVSVVVGCRPALTDADRQWLADNAVYCHAEILMGHQTALLDGNAEAVEWLKHELDFQRRD